MPWQNARIVPFTRIGVVSQVPSASGVYGILEGDICLLVAESWNLKARLLELANVLSEETQLTVIFETCSDEVRERRKQALASEYLTARDEGRDAPLPGIRLRDRIGRPA
jgi:hypothetical protein